MLDPKTHLPVGPEVLRGQWGWFVALGMLLVVLGTLAMGSSVMMTMFSMLYLGVMMLAAGFAETFHAFGCKKWSGFFVDLLTGILYLVVGFMVISHPAETGIRLTLLIAMFLIFGGVFRMLLALFVRFPNWVWVFLHGAINLVLGISIWRQWPLDGLWVIGLFVGIDMLFNGWSLIMLGIMIRKLPPQETPATT